MDKTLVRQHILQKAIEHAVFDGWNEATIKTAAADAGYSEFDYIRACPNGIHDILDEWFSQADAAMIETAEDAAFASVKIRQKIKMLVLSRIDFFAPHKEAYRRAHIYLTLPMHTHKQFTRLSHVVDLMWKLAGDTSNDYNWYTKRFLLSGVYTSTLIYWFNDESEGYQATISFLERRIENVIKIGGSIGGTLKKFFG